MCNLYYLPFSFFCFFHLMVVQVYSFSVTSLKMSSKLHCCNLSILSATAKSRESGDLERELDTSFLEIAAAQGGNGINSMTPEERVERVLRGEKLEDSIFDLRSKIIELETMPKQDAILLNKMRVEMKNLKNEYKDIVGADDMPMYMGRLSDNLQ